MTRNCAKSKHNLLPFFLGATKKRAIPGGVLSFSFLFFLEQIVKTNTWYNFSSSSLSSRYQKASDKDSYRYEDEFFEYLTYLTNDLQRKIRRGKERKDKEVDETVSRQRERKEEESKSSARAMLKPTCFKH
jgi:hypothetical protein